MFWTRAQLGAGLAILSTLELTTLHNATMEGTQGDTDEQIPNTDRNDFYFAKLSA